MDLGLLNDYVRLGVAEMVNRAAERAEARAARSSSSEGCGATGEDGAGRRGAAVASALSVALCAINRFMVASHAGVSALANMSSLRRRDDEGILALMGGGGAAHHRVNARRRGGPTPERCSRRAC